jgi:hypothetical protein
MANEIWDPAYIDWLMNTPQFEDDVSYDEDILADQGKRLTQASKYGNLVTDLDYQLATGGLQPGAFEPLVSYESVETPGRKRLNQWMGGSPYQKYVAEWLGSGRSANELLSDLTKMVAQPTGDPLENDIIGDMPKGQFYDEMTGQYKFTDQPNMAAVGEELRSFETDLLSDPEHIIGPDGTPVKVLSEDSPAMKKWRAAGMVSDPTAEYSAYDLAPAGTEQRDALMPVVQGAREAAVLANTELMRAARRDVEAARNAQRRFLDHGDQQRGLRERIAADANHNTVDEWRPGEDIPVPAVGGGRPSTAGGGGGPASRERTPQRGGWADDAERITEHPGASIFGAMQDLAGKITRLPGTVSRTAQNVDQWTEGLAGGLDRTIGDPIEARGAGDEPWFSLPHSYTNRSHGFFTPFTDQPNGLDSGGDRGGVNASPARRSMINAGLLGGGAEVLGPRQRAARQQGQALAGARAEIGRGLERRTGAAAVEGRAAVKALNAARAQVQQSQADAIIARRDQALRQAMAAQLAAAGRTPASDELNARRARALGLGG